MRDLFSGIEEESRRYRGTWTPEAPPVLDGIRDIELDCETTSLRWWDRSAPALPIGIAIRLPSGKRQYLPWGHRGGGNLDESMMKRWAQRELRGKRITNINTRFDIHVLENWGINLENQGNEVSDVAHYAGLLDDHRQRFSLDTLAFDWLGERKTGKELDKTRMADYHAGEVADYATWDVELVHRLKEKMWPLLDEQELQEVRQLEDDVIYPVVSMEREGTLIDVDLLDRWVKESEQEYLRILWEINRETGVKFTGTNTEWQALFRNQSIPIVALTEKGAPSFTDAVLKPIENPYVQKARRAIRIASLRAKYLVKYQKTVDRSTGVLRYALHQLRAQKNEMDESEGAGTVSGRFSSTALTVPGEEDTGINIQQCMKVAKQRVSFGYDEDDDSHDDEIYVIRRLHVPAKGQLFLSADAKQIEYRLFAHYAKSQKVIDAYKKDPDLSFHKYIHSLIKPFFPLTYRQQKDLNFAKIYGAGLAKLALMIGLVSKHEYDQLYKQYNGRIPWKEPKLADARKVQEIYARELPEVTVLLEEAKNLAETSGFVKTLIGRRSRFPDKYRIHKALNCVIQGSGADINKRKLVELHRAARAKEIAFMMRYTVHDEVDGDTPDRENARKIAKLLDQQSFELRIPILWDVSVGPNWKDQDETIESGYGKAA